MSKIPCDPIRAIPSGFFLSKKAPKYYRKTAKKRITVSEYILHQNYFIYRFQDRPGSDLSQDILKVFQPISL